MRRRMSAQAFPRVQPDVMMITARADKRRARSHALRQFKSQHSAIKSQRPLQIRDLEVDMPDPDAGTDGTRC